MSCPYKCTYRIDMKNQIKQSPQIFLCYARKDEKPVSELYKKLSGAGLKPFMDTKDILPGEDWKQRLMNTIREAPFFLACLSGNSVDKRGVIQEEIREALEVWRQKLDSDIYFIPVRLEDCAVPGALAKFQWVDLFHDGGFERLKMAIDTGMERLGVIRPLRLRSESLKILNENRVKLMLQENDFFHVDWYWMGKGVQHQYEVLEDGKVVFDKTTGLFWQQSGSEKDITYYEAKRYIRELNKKHFAGYNDWRLPTLEEAMSLMEPKKNKHELYIDAVFDNEQMWIWTADKESASAAWVVYFYAGYCGVRHVDDGAVRAVRGGQT